MIKKLKENKKWLGAVSFILLVSFLITMQYDPEWNKKYPLTTGNTVTIFLIDGLSSAIFEEELMQGNLPNLQKMIHNGVYTENGISSFPTMTGYGFYPFITGADATKSGILGLRWFDRKRSEGNLRNYVGRTNIHMNSDLNDSIKNIFELSDLYYTASINTYMNKGVKHSIMTGWAHTTAKYEGKNVFKWLRKIPFWGSSIAKNHFEHESAAISLALKQLKKNPKVHWITFPSPDAHNHIAGTDASYRKLIIQLDSLIGQYYEEVIKLGQEKNRMIAVVSDHGISDVYTNFDFCPWFKFKTGLSVERGKSVHILSDDLNQSLDEIREKDGYFVINGNLTAYLYMKNPYLMQQNQWSFPTPHHILEHYPTEKGAFNLPELLAENNNLELILSKDSLNNVLIRSGTKKAVIVSSKAGLKYSIVSGNPLGYADSLCNIAYSEQSWLYKTTDTAFPYAIPRIWNLMQSPGIGDIVITSRKGVDLAKDYEVFVENYKGGHGGLRKELITVPFILTLPGNASKKWHALRNEDVGIMIKNHLGL